MMPSSECERVKDNIVRYLTEQFQAFASFLLYQDGRHACLFEKIMLLLDMLKNSW